MFYVISIGVIILMNLQFILTANFLNSDDYSCSCGCTITDSFGNVLEKANSPNCGQKLTIFYKNLTFDCPCGCNGILPNKFHFLIKPSPIKCSTHSLVKVLDKDLPNCQCGCVNYSLMPGFTFSVNKDYVLKVDHMCNIVPPPINTFNPFDFNQMFLPSPGTIQSNPNFLRPSQPNINLFQPPQSNTNLLQPPLFNTNLLQPPQSNTNLLQPPLFNTNLLQPPQSNTNLLPPIQSNASPLQPLKPNTSKPNPGLTQPSNPQQANLDLSLLGTVPG